MMKRLVAVLALVAALPACGGSDDASPDKPFDLHFVVLVTSPEAMQAASEQRLRQEAAILNRHFVGADGEPVARFRYKGAVYARQLGDSPCSEMRALGEAKSGYNGARWNALINDCHDPRLRDPSAINIYVIDGWSQERGFGDMDSHGRHNQGRPYLILDWERLGHHLQSPEEHEMGHAFGLGHVCVENAGRETPTNIMASAGDCSGSGGLRNRGFNPDQIETIHHHATAIRQRLGDRR